MNNIIAIFLVCISLLTGCGNIDSAHDGAQKAEYKRISASEAKQMMESADDYILLDVRTEQEFNERRIEGAVLIPDYEIEAVQRLNFWIRMHSYSSIAAVAAEVKMPRMNLCQWGTQMYMILEA